jgi:beta-N-acetylhexosaminidase
LDLITHGYHPGVNDLRRAIGQLLWVGFDGTTAPAPLLSRISAGEAGAAIIFGRNLAGIEPLVALNRSLHEAAPTDAPLLVCVDQEGGTVQRVRAPATVWPPMLGLSRLPSGEEVAEAAGLGLGKELAALGFDVDFAPVLDVHTNPQNPVIGPRAFAETAEGVTKLAGAFARGLAEAGVLPCGKHFPGHGDTHTDSHFALPRVDHPMERLRAVELAPFAALRDLPLLMTAHVIFAALDPDLPATLSPRVVSGLLRGELGYQGVVVSDDLEMKAIADHFGLEDAAVRAILAGCDVLLLCHAEELQLRAMEGLLEAAEKDAELRRRIGESAARVLTLKARHRSNWAERTRPELAILGSHQAVAAQITRGA